MQIVANFTILQENYSKLLHSPPHNNFVFEPNIVEYAVDVESELGQKIRQSNAGIVIHRMIDVKGNESPLQDFDIFTGTNVLVVPPMSVEKPAQKISPALNKLEELVNKNATLNIYTINISGELVKNNYYIHYFFCLD